MLYLTLADFEIILKTVQNYLMMNWPFYQILPRFERNWFNLSTLWEENGSILTPSQTFCQTSLSFPSHPHHFHAKITQFFLIAEVFGTKRKTGKGAEKKTVVCSKILKSSTPPTSNPHHHRLIEPSRLGKKMLRWFWHLLLLSSLPLAGNSNAFIKLAWYLIFDICTRLNICSNIDVWHFHPSLEYLLQLWQEI